MHLLSRVRGLRHNLVSLLLEAEEKARQQEKSAWDESKQAEDDSGGSTRHFPSRISSQQEIAALIDAGVNQLDASPVYRNFKGESLSDLLRLFHNRRLLKQVTKIWQAGPSSASSKSRRIVKVTT